MISPSGGRTGGADFPNTKIRMATADLNVLVDTELERVENWRAEELIRAGYAPGDAVALAARHDIDLHLAVELVERGCPDELAIEILI